MMASYEPDADNPTYEENCTRYLEEGEIQMADGYYESNSSSSNSYIMYNENAVYHNSPNIGHYPKLVEYKNY